jgi:large conductance mechanosensitive channel
MLKEFKNFAMKGNVIDLAVAVVIGGAFGKIVSSLVNDLIMPIIGALLGGLSFANLKYVITPASGDVAEAAILYGSFIQSIVDFVIVAFAIFVFVKILSSVKKKEEEAPAPAPEPPKDLVLLEEIRDLLKEANR